MPLITEPKIIRLLLILFMSLLPLLLLVSPKIDKQTLVILLFIWNIIANLLITILFADAWARRYIKSRVHAYARDEGTEQADYYVEWKRLERLPGFSIQPLWFAVTHKWRTMAGRRETGVEDDMLGKQRARGSDERIQDV